MSLSCVCADKHVPWWVHGGQRTVMLVGVGCLFLPSKPQMLNPRQRGIRHIYSLSHLARSEK